MSGSADRYHGQQQLGPPSGEVPWLPIVGRTWYRRRGSYWARRAGAVLLWLGLAAFVAFVTIAILVAVGHRSAAGFYTVLAIEAAYSLGFPAWFVARTARMWDTPADPADPAGLHRGVAGRPDWAQGLLRPVYWLCQVLLALSWLTIGFHVAFLLASLMPEPLPERRARLRLTAQQQGGAATA